MKRETSTSHQKGDKYLSLQEVGDILGVSAKTVRRRISEGHLPAVRVGTGRSAIRVKESDVHATLYVIQAARRLRRPG